MLGAGDHPFDPRSFLREFFFEYLGDFFGPIGWLLGLWGLDHLNDDWFPLYACLVRNGPLRSQSLYGGDFLTRGFLRNAKLELLCRDSFGCRWRVLSGLRRDQKRKG